MSELDRLARIGTLALPLAASVVGGWLYGDHVRLLQDAEVRAAEREARLRALGTMVDDEGWTAGQIEHWITHGALPPPPGPPWWQPAASAELLAEIGRACWESTRPPAATSGSRIEDTPTTGEPT